MFFGGPSDMFAGVLTGVNFLKCFLFLIVILLEPKVITLYCLCSVSAWITTPRLSHRLGWLPSKFWMRTQSPGVLAESVMKLC